MKMKNPLRLAVMSVVCMSAGTLAFADNRTGGGTSTMDPNKPGSPANIANTGSSASTDADRNGAANANAGMAGQQGQGDQQMLAALRQIASEPETAADKLFVLDAAGMDAFEVEFARLAQEKAQDPQVKELARMIMQDHQQSMQQLQQWSQRKNLTLPSGLPAAKQAKLAVYRAMPTEQFETCYVVENRAGHAKAISSYRDHAKTVKDDGLKQYVTASLPKLEMHGQHVHRVAMAKNLGDNTANAMGSTPMRPGDTGTAGSGTPGSGTSSTGSGTAGSGSSGTGTPGGTGSTGSGTSGSGTAGAGDR